MDESQLPPRAWERIDQNHLVCRERALASDGRRLVSRKVVVHSERRVIVDRFYAERLYNREQVRELFEAALDEEKKRQLSDHSIQLFERLECRDYARFDFCADDQGNIKLLEVNPNPGWCWDGKLNLMAEFGGLRYAEMLRLILQAGLDRLGNDNNLQKKMV